MGKKLLWLESLEIVYDIWRKMLGDIEEFSLAMVEGFGGVKLASGANEGI